MAFSVVSLILLPSYADLRQGGVQADHRKAARWRASALGQPQPARHVCGPARRHTASQLARLGASQERAPRQGRRGAVATSDSQERCEGVPWPVWVRPGHSWALPYESQSSWQLERWTPCALCTYDLPVGLLCSLPRGVRQCFCPPRCVRVASNPQSAAVPPAPGRAGEIATATVAAPAAATAPRAPTASPCPSCSSCSCARTARRVPNSRSTSS